MWLTQKKIKYYFVTHHTHAQVLYVSKKQNKKGVFASFLATPFYPQSSKFLCLICAISSSSSSSISMLDDDMKKDVKHILTL